MRAYKLACALWALMLTEGLVAQPPIGAAADKHWQLAASGTHPAEVPALNDTHRQFLSRLVRRTLRDEAAGRKLYEPAYVPAGLGDLSLEAVVRLRQGGFLRAAGTSGPAPAATAVRDAASSAWKSMGAEASADIALVEQLLIEIEALGPARRIEIEGDWTQPRAVDPFIEPGVHGMVVRGPRAQHRFCPSDIVTSDMILSDVLAKLSQLTHTDGSKLADAELLAFRTAHWYEPSPGAKIVSLHRGLTLVESEAVSPAGLDEAIARLAAYMAYRQRASGLFAYQYEPAIDVYSDENNLVRQVGATLAMAVHASTSGASASRAAADIGIRFHLQGLKDIPEVENAAFIATTDKRNKLGVTALLCTAMAAHPDSRAYAPVREKLVNGMLWLQRPSGMFVTAFPPAEQIDAQDYFPGEALLAMATQYAHDPSAKILDAFDRAIAYYRGYFRDEPSPAFVPWQVQAYTLMAGQTKRKDYIDYVFELTDWLAGMQLNPSNCPWPELHGGIASYQAGRTGIATASYLEAFADALSLARETGDAQRAARYEIVVRLAARFVMQLQVRPEEAYFIRSPQDAVGGMRTGPALNLLRIDHCQHALIALIKTRKVLYPEQG